MARSFNGTSDKIDIGTIANPNTGSFSCWINGSSFSHTYNNVISANIAQAYNFYVKSTGKMALIAGNAAIYDPGTITLNTGTWYHVAFAGTWSGSGAMTGYVNGVQDATGTTVSTSSTQDVNIGNDLSTPGRLWAGSIADVAFWNVILTPSEITALAAGARPLQIRPKSLLYWLPLGGLQSPEPDISGFANNGTLTGTAPDFGPPFLQFTPRWQQGLAPVAAPTFSPAWARNRNTVIQGVAT